MKKTVVLIILDGFGSGPPDFSNPIHVARTPHLDHLRAEYPFGLLQASGISVGLPWHEEGNSEVGHLTIGLGTVLYQHYPRITLATQSSSTFQNDVLLQAATHAKTHRSRLHLVGLLTEGVVHAAYDHLTALLEFAKQHGVPSVWLHLITDGWDSPPQSATLLLQQLERDIKTIGTGAVGTLCGRRYGLDKEGYWNLRTERAFRLMVEGIGRETPHYIDHLRNAYHSSDFNDQDLEPLVVNPESAIADNDVVIFFNFREDGISQLARSFVDPHFQKFSRPTRRNLFFVCFTKYFRDIDVPVAFPQQPIVTHLTQELSRHGKRQMKIAETIKAAHLTYFFNGLTREPYPNEFWKVLPPPEKDILDQPEMRSGEITGILIQALREGIYDFIAVNYAAPDIVGHTGNFQAALRLIPLIDTTMAEVTNAALAHDATAIITADHGNLERIALLPSGELQTKHDASPVPCYLIDKRLHTMKSPEHLKRELRDAVGTLADIAPTILEFLKLPTPQAMKGKSLIPVLAES